MLKDFQFSSTAVIQPLSCVWLFATPWTAAYQASLSFSISWSLLKLMSIEPWCHPAISSSVTFSSCPQSFPASGSFQIESVLCIRWPNYWSFNFNISSSNEHSGLISFRMYWFDFLAVQGTLKSLLKSLLSPPLSVVLLSAVLVIVLNHGLQRLNGKFQK